MLLLATSFVYFFNPDFEGTCNWLSGSCNYVWTILICLLFFVPYVDLLEGKKNTEKDSIWKVCLMLIAGVVAGWTNENIAPVFALMAFTTIIWSKKKNNVIPFWTVLGLIGLVCGIVFMLLAPGNSVRATYIATEVNTGYSLLKTLLVRCYYVERAIFTCLFPTLLALSLTLLASIYIFKIYPDMVTIMFMCSGVLSVGAMVLSPTYPIRAIFGSMIDYSARFVVRIVRNNQES